MKFRKRDVEGLWEGVGIEINNVAKNLGTLN